MYKNKNGIFFESYTFILVETILSYLLISQIKIDDSLKFSLSLLDHLFNLQGLDSIDTLSVFGKFDSIFQNNVEEIQQLSSTNWTIDLIGFFYFTKIFKY